jgi:hypothetical protein
MPHPVPLAAYPQFDKLFPRGQNKTGCERCHPKNMTARGAEGADLQYVQKDQGVFGHRPEGKVAEYYFVQEEQIGSWLEELQKSLRQKINGEGTG